MKFKIPAGFEIPPDVDPGGTFTVVADLKDNEDGTVTLVAIDGAELNKSESEPRNVYGRAKAAGLKMKEDM